MLELLYILGLIKVFIRKNNSLKFSNKSLHRLGAEIHYNLLLNTLSFYINIFLKV